MKKRSRTILATATFLAMTINAAVTSRGAEPPAIADQQYQEAVALQNRGQYTQAAQRWVAFCNTHQTDARRGRAFYYLGVCYLKSNEHDLARQCFEIVLQSFPQFEMLDATRFYLGVTQFEIARSGKPEQYDAAAATLETVVTKHPQSQHVGDALFYRAESLYHREKRAPAAETYQQLLTRFPEHPLAPDAAYALGVTLDELGQKTEAAKRLATFLEKYPLNPLAAEVTIRRAALLAEEKNYTEAATLYASLAAKWPKSPLLGIANLAGGKCYYLAGNFAKARTLLELALATGDDSVAEAAHWLIRSFLEEGKPTEALAAAERVLARLPEKRRTAELLFDHADAAYATPDRRKDSPALYALVAAQFPNDPRAPRALYLASSVALAEGDHPDALKHANAYLAAYPKTEWTVDVAHIAAECQLQLRQYADATKAFAELLEKHPQHANAADWKTRHALSLYQLGWAKLDANDHQAAADVFNSLLEKHADNKLAPRARYARGIARYHLKNTAEALEDARALLTADPTPDEKADARYLLGLCQVAGQQHADAAATFESLLKDLPQYADADKVLYELAWTLLQQGKEDAAAAAFSRLATEHASSPLAAEALYHAGEFAFKSGDLHKAIAAYREAFQKDHQTELGEKVAYKVADACFRLGDFAAAEKALRQQRATWPNGPLASDGAFLLGESLVKQKKFSEALAAYEQVMRPTSKDAAPMALLHAGQAAGELKQCEKSLALLTRCAEQFPTASCLAEVLCEQGFAKQNLGRRDEAAALYTQVISQTTTETAARAQFLIGEIQFQQKNHAEAIKSYVKVSYGYSYPHWQAEAAFAAGRAMEASGQNDKAIQQYRSLLEKFPQSDKAATARKRIKSLE